MFPSRQIFASPRIRRRIAQALWATRKASQGNPLNCLSAENVYYTTIILNEGEPRCAFAITEYCHFRIAEAILTRHLAREASK